MNLQLRWDLYHAREAEADILKEGPRYKATKRDKVPIRCKVADSEGAVSASASPFR